MTHPVVCLRTATWVVAALLALGLLSAPGAPLGMSLAVAEPSLALSGDADGLVPGRPGQVHVTLVNAGSADVSVHRVAAVVSGGGCGASGLRVAPWHGALVVPASGSATVALPAVVSAEPGCDGGRWHVDYVAS